MRNYDRRIPLYLNKNPYDINGTEDIFLGAVRQNLFYHILHNPEYARIVEVEMKLNGMSGKSLAAKAVEKIRKPCDISLIPPIPTALFKRRNIRTMDNRKMLIKATSSGTKRKRSEMGYDLDTIIFGAALTFRLGSFHGLFSAKPANYIMLGFEPHPSNKTVIAKTQRISSFFAPPLRKSYALKYTKSGYRLDAERVLRSLCSFERSVFPVRIIGFPSYFYFLLKKLEASGKRLKFPKGSMVLLGGGWKSFEGIKVDADELRRLSEHILGIDGACVREFFGAAEHPCLYCSCKNGHFHVPIYSRVLIRDGKNLEPLSYGKEGLLNLITPIAESIPLLSVMTDDIAVLREGKDCGCGIQTPYFEIVKRVGLPEIVTCAQSAYDLVGFGG